MVRLQKLLLQSGAVTSVEITEGGSGYTNGETLFFDSQTPENGGIGGSPNASITIATAGISSATGNYIQVTGITTGTDSYHRITSVNGTEQITVAKSALIQYLMTNRFMIWALGLQLVQRLQLLELHNLQLL